MESKLLRTSSMMTLVLIFSSSLISSTLALRNGPAPALSLSNGFPGGASVVSAGESLVPLIMNSPEFKAIAKGLPYHVKPYSSFGYSWGSGVPSTERVILFSRDESSYIVAEMQILSREIRSISFHSSSESDALYACICACPMHHISPACGGGGGGGGGGGAGGGTTYELQPSNYGGYRAQYCTGIDILFACNGKAALGAAAGYQDVPSTIGQPSGANAACCMMAQWTGVSQDDSAASGFVQGGIAWSGFNLAALPSSNSNGFSLFVENPPAPPIFFAPWTGMNGVKGQRFYLATEIGGSCAWGDEWYQVWELDPYVWTSQQIACEPASSEMYGWYIFESPYSPTACSNANGGFNGLCQIPSFNNLGFTGDICKPLPTNDCRGIDSNADPVKSYVIVQHNQDTTTSGTSNGNSWTEAFANPTVE